MFIFHFEWILTIQVVSCDYRDNDLGPTSENNPARAALRRRDREECRRVRSMRRGLLYDESKWDMLFRIILF